MWNREDDLSPSDERRAGINIPFQVSFPGYVVLFEVDSVGTMANSRLLCPHLTLPAKRRRPESAVVTNAHTMQKFSENSKKEPGMSRAGRLSDKFHLQRYLLLLTEAIP